MSELPVADRTELVRKALVPFWKASRSSAGRKPVHPGLMLDRGWPVFLKASQSSALDWATPDKSTFLDELCRLGTDPIYQRAYERWLTATDEVPVRFQRTILSVESRLLIGLGNSGALETSCAISQTYGVPYLPGSSVKGAVRAWAREAFPDQKPLIAAMFGEDDASASGLVSFYDAWWVPGSGPQQTGQQNRPFVRDIVTPHHSEYYTGSADATDMDSPIPNALVGVQGSFLFVTSGDQGWSNLAIQWIKEALSQRGVGAKTRAGYGRFSEPTNGLNRDLAKRTQVHLTGADKVAAFVRDLKEDAAAVAFSSGWNKTKTDFPDDFPLLVAEFKREKATWLAAWSSQSKETAKGKAYRKLQKDL